MTRNRLWGVLVLVLLFACMGIAGGKKAKTDSIARKSATSLEKPRESASAREAQANLGKLAMPENIPACRVFNAVYRRALRASSSGSPSSTGGDSDLAFLEWMNPRELTVWKNASDCHKAVLNPKSLVQTVLHLLTYDQMLTTINLEYEQGSSALAKRYNLLVRFLRNVQITRRSIGPAPSLPSSCTIMKVSSDLVTLNCN